MLLAVEVGFVEGDADGVKLGIFDNIVIGVVDMLGVADGLNDGGKDFSDTGPVLGKTDGKSLLIPAGAVDGDIDGKVDGVSDGISDGSPVGTLSGANDGCELGIKEGTDDGIKDVTKVGVELGRVDEMLLGICVVFIRVGVDGA